MAFILQSAVFEMMAFCRDSAFCLSECCPYYRIEWVQCCFTIWWSFNSSVWLLFLIPPTRCHYLHLTERILLDLTVIRKIACVFTCKYWIKAVCYCCERLLPPQAGTQEHSQKSSWICFLLFLVISACTKSAVVKQQKLLPYFFFSFLQKSEKWPQGTKFYLCVCTYVYTHTCIEISSLIT